MDEAVLSWFESCTPKVEMVLEMHEKGTLVYHSSFPVCEVKRKERTTESKHVRFRLKGGRTVDAWQAGADPDALLLGIVIWKGKQELLNTIHIAKIHAQSVTEIDPGLFITTSALRRSAKSN